MVEWEAVDEEMEEGGSGQGDRGSRSSGGSDKGRESGGRGGGSAIDRRKVGTQTGVSRFESNPPTLDGPSRCPHCLCAPCVTTPPLTFLVAGAAQVVRPVRPWPDQYSMGGIRYELICMVCIVN